MKKFIPHWCRILILSISLLFINGSAFASHLVGMDFNYAWDSGNTYKLTVVAYGNCGTASSSSFGTLGESTPQICIFEGTTWVATIYLHIDSALSFKNVTPVCPADSNLTQCTNPADTIPGIEKFTYTGYYTLPTQYKCWRFVYTGNMGPGAEAGRAASITNIPSTGTSIIGLIDTLNNTISDRHNSSPDLTVLPVPFFCNNSADNYNPGAVDPDGDSLAFFLVPGWNGNDDCSESSMAATTYNPGYSGANPMPVPADATSFSFNSATGQISFTPDALQRALVVYNIEEYRKGALADTLVGTSQREMTFTVITCTNTSPTASIDSATGDGTVDDGTHYHICANSGAFSLILNAHEPDASNLITVAASGLPVGATFSVTGNGTSNPQAILSWTSTGVTFGNYTFYITYTDNNCPLSGQQTLAYTIGIYPIPTISYSIIQPASCLDSAIIFVVPGGLGQPWTVDVSLGTDTLLSHSRYNDTLAFSDTLSPGVYTFTIYSSLSTLCNGSEIVTIDAPTLTTTGTFTSPTFCGNNDGSIVLSGLNGGALDNVSYQFGGVAQPSELLTVSPGGDITLGSLCAGSYSDIVVSYGSCTTTPVGAFDLVNPGYPTIRFDTTNPKYCGAMDGTITLYGLQPNQTDSVNYLLNGTAQTAVVNFVGPDSMFILSGLGVGLYSNITVTTGGICNAVPACTSNVLGPVTLTAPYISPKFDTLIHLGCNGDTILFTNLSTAPGSPVIHYTWNFGDGSAPDTSTSPLHVYLASSVSATYTITLTLNNNGCDSMISETVTLNNFITASFTSTPASFVCQGNPVVFDNTSYGSSTSSVWYFGDGNSSTLTNPTHTYPNTGNYVVMLVASNNVPCYDTATEILAVDSNSVLSLQISDSSLCEGHAVTLTGYYSTLGLTNVTWLFGDGTYEENANPVAHSYDTSGLLTVTIQLTYRACPDYSISQDILVVANPAMNLGHDTSICPGGTSIVLVDNINAGNPGAAWLWSTGVTTPALTVTAPGLYYSTVTINGCSASDTVLVQNNCYMDIPNAFTPNGDGTNDYFFPRQFLTRGLTTFKMDIFNRWGENIFESTSTDGRGWDGTFNNTPQPAGVYIYVIDATFVDGQKEHKQGNITLIR